MSIQGLDSLFLDQCTDGTLAPGFSSHPQFYTDLDPGKTTKIMSFRHPGLTVDHYSTYHTLTFITCKLASLGYNRKK